MTFPEIRTERCLLRQIDPADKADILRGLSDPAVTEFMPIHYSTLDEVENQMEFYRNHWEFGTGLFWAIELLESNSFAGVMGLYDINQLRNSAEWGFWLLPEFRGKGIIRETGPHIMDYAFLELDLNRVKAEIEAENKASVKVMEKFGFIYEGTLRQCEINRQGKYIDLMIYSRLRSDV